MELINQGLFLMIIGMGSVFAFLAAMQLAMNICSKLITILNKYFPEAKEEPKKKIQKTDSEAETAIAIACAVQKMRRAEL